MIHSNVTHRTVITNMTGLDNKPTATETAFEMGGEMHSFVLDGRIEDSIARGMIDPEKGFTSLEQLSSLVKDEKGGLAKAQRLIADGAETVKVDVGQAEKWTAKATDKPGVVELTNEGGLYGNEQSIRVSGDYLSLTTRPSLYSQNENVSQKLVGKFNAATGTITCVREEIERVVTQEAPAPLAKPDAQPIPEPISSQPAANRPGEISTTGAIDAKVYEPVRQAAGGAVFTGFDDERLQTFADWAQGKTDTCYGTALAALPEGWQEMGKFDMYAQPGNNYKIGDHQQFQILTVDQAAGTVSLRTQHNYRRPGDFEGSHDEVVLTRYADGEVRREYNEMHD